MSESNLWAKLRTNMVGTYWSEATRHEDKLSRGIADVSFCQEGRHGWMELKWVADWPARDSTIIRIPHYSTEQKAFLDIKGKAGGNTWLFLQIGSDHLLFDFQAAQTVGDVPKAELIDLAEGGYWERRLKYDELAQYMRVCRGEY